MALICEQVLVCFIFFLFYSTFCLYFIYLESPVKVYLLKFKKKSQFLNSLVWRKKLVKFISKVFKDANNQELN